MRLSTILDSLPVVIPSTVLLAALAGMPSAPKHRPKTCREPSAQTFASPSRPRSQDPVPVALTSDLQAVALQARMVPAFQDGVNVGFRLFAVRPDSVYSWVGLHNGDVIRRVNRYELRSPDKLLELFAALSRATHLDAEIDRAGQPLALHYDAQPDASRPRPRESASWQ